MDVLESEGFVALAGPLLGSPDAQVIIRAETPEGIDEKLSADPWSGLDLFRTIPIIP